MTERYLIAGNWKMHGTSASAARLAGELASGLGDAAAREFDMLVCPPAPLLAVVRASIGAAPLLLGAQDCHPREAGAHTGDVSAAMLADAGCSHVIVGHSERRADHGEESALVRAKAEAARAAGLVPVICIGETLAEREAGRAAEVVIEQLAASLPEDCAADDAVIAYEPVWAIGTGRTPTVREIADMHHAIRVAVEELADDVEDMRILYGGSVKPDNADSILAVPFVDGALVGGASLDAASFLEIAAFCS